MLTGPCNVETNTYDTYSVDARLPLLLVTPAPLSLTYVYSLYSRREDTRNGFTMIQKTRDNDNSYKRYEKMSADFRLTQ